MASAVGRRKLLFFVPLILFLGAAAAIGIVRKPVYSAEARLQVGTVNLDSPAGGFVESAQALAASYSRAIDGDEIVRPVARKLEFSANTARARLSASPVPESNLMSVKAKAPAEAEAIGLANAASKEMIRYTTELNDDTSNGQRLLARYRDATRDYERLLRRGGGQQSARATGAVAAAELRVKNLARLYQANQEPTQIVHGLTRATSASSDQMSFLSKALFVGLAAGLLSGLALATWRANRDLALATWSANRDASRR